MKLRILLLLTALVASSSALLQNGVEEAFVAAQRFNTHEVDISPEKTDLIVSINSKASELPLVYINIDKSFSEENKLNSDFICNQLGKEHCFVPKSYLSSAKNINLTVECDGCEYTVKPEFTSNLETLNLGEPKKVHLKAGSSISFNLSGIKDDTIILNAFNMRESGYSLSIQNTSAPERNYNTQQTWKNGRSARISNDESSFVVTVSAEGDSFISIESFTQNKPITVSEPIFSIEELHDDTKCYSIKFPEEKETAIVDVKILNGDNIYIEKAAKGAFEKVSSDIVIDLNLKERNEICVKSEGEGVFLLQIFTDKSLRLIKNMKKVLVRKSIFN